MEGYKELSCHEMGVVHHGVPKSFGYIELATFYDTTKYEVKFVKTGDIETGFGGRPYHIIFLRKKSDNSDIIFINLHNDHNVEKDILQRCLSSNLENIVKNKNNAIDIEKIETMDKQNYKNDLESVNNPIVIVAGDFNDHQGNDYYKKFQPFINSNINKIKNITVKSDDVNLPTSCCYDHYAFYGDYVISNQSRTINEFAIVNHSPYSDHKPVIGTIILNSGAGEPMGTVPSFRLKNELYSYPFVNKFDKNDYVSIPEDKIYLADGVEMIIIKALIILKFLDMLEKNILKKMEININLLVGTLVIHLHLD